uniref:Small cysteine-rich protein 2 n=1 Tax=Acropora millepora TaxID=45264 RepID=SCR2D_ACRMI|nr:RecName: Full=Small cysteine-rich protein 2; Short=Amil-SCRiP2; Short=SCRiP2; Flags: Precursor [Acropora millepora]DAA06483.1 TPA_inf: small cysteine-rich protein 2 [Acropora millepora]
MRSQHVLILLLGLVCASQVLGKHLTKVKAKALHYDKRGDCDWPTGVCFYIHDPCPPGLRRCPQHDDGCYLPTNHCCCYP